MSQDIQASFTCFAFSLFILGIVFFSLNFKEIKENSFIQVPCTVLDSKVISKNCCNYYCPATNYLTCLSSTTTKLCQQVIHEAEILQPDKCPTDSSQCFKQNTDCSGGYQCCSTFCETCKTCVTKDDCRYYPCYCRCSSYTYNLACYVTCKLCYSLKIEVQYNYDEKLYQVYKTWKYGSDYDTVENEVKSYFIGSKHVCYINKNSPKEFTLEVRYTPWKWILLIIMSLFCLITLWASIYSVLTIKTSYAAAYTTSAVFGIITPIIILIIYQISQIKILLTIICFLIGIGNTWSVFVSREYIVEKTIFFVPAFITLLVFIPVLLNNYNDAVIIITIITNIMPFFVYAFYKYNYKFEPIYAYAEVIEQYDSLIL